MDGPQWAWTNQDMLLADVFDAVQSGVYSLVGALGGKPKKPEAHPRPGDDTRGSRTGRRGVGVTTADVVTYLDTLKAG